MSEIVISQALQQNLDGTIVNGDYESRYLEMLAAQTAKTESLKKEYDFRDFLLSKIRNVQNKVEAYTGRTCYPDFTFPGVMGDVLGIIRTLCQSRQIHNEIVRDFNIPLIMLQDYYRMCGNYPYIATRKNGEEFIVQGMYPDWDKVHNYLRLFTAKLGIILTDEDLKEYNPDTWKKKYEYELQKCQETLGMQQNINIDNFD